MPSTHRTSLCTPCEGSRRSGSQAPEHGFRSRSDGGKRISRQYDALEDVSWSRLTVRESSAGLTGTKTSSGSSARGPCEGQEGESAIEGDMLVEDGEGGVEWRRRQKQRAAPSDEYSSRMTSRLLCARHASGQHPSIWKGALHSRRHLHTPHGCPPLSHRASRCHTKGKGAHTRLAAMGSPARPRGAQKTGKLEVYDCYFVAEAMVLLHRDKGWRGSCAYACALGWSVYTRMRVQDVVIDAASI